MLLGALTFDNALKRQSLGDLIQVFEDGFDIKETSFFTKYSHFMKIFNEKAIKALRLLNVLLPLGFGDDSQKLITCEDQNISIDAEQNPV